MAQRHRHQRIGVGQKLVPGLRDPASHHRREVEPVAIFQRMNQSARYLVEAHRGASTVIGRRVGDGFHGQDARTRVIHEGNAEPLAIGAGDEREFRPARCAQAAALDRLAAGGAELRQSKIERRAQHAAHRARGASDRIGNGDAQ
jgi:hypothetical protein